MLIINGLSVYGMKKALNEVVKKQYEEALLHGKAVIQKPCGLSGITLICLKILQAMQTLKPLMQSKPNHLKHHLNNTSP